MTGTREEHTFDDLNSERLVEVFDSTGAKERSDRTDYTYVYDPSSLLDYSFPTFYPTKVRQTLDNNVVCGTDSTYRFLFPYTVTIGQEGNGNPQTITNYAPYTGRPDSTTTYDCGSGAIGSALVNETVTPAASYYPAYLGGNLLAFLREDKSTDENGTTISDTVNDFSPNIPGDCGHSDTLCRYLRRVAERARAETDSTVHL